HDALRHGVGAGLLRRRLRAAGGMVAGGLRDLAGESGDLAGDRAVLVEAGGDLVKPGDRNPGRNPGTEKPGRNPGTDGTFSGFRPAFPPRPASKRRWHGQNASPKENPVKTGKRSVCPRFSPGFPRFSLFSDGGLDKGSRNGRINFI